MQEQERKKKKIDFSELLHSKAKVISHTPLQGSAGCGNVWIEVRHKWHITHNLHFFINMRQKRQEPLQPKPCLVGRRGNPPSMLRIKTTRKRRWMNRWISRWRLSSWMWTTLKLLRRCSNLLTFIIIQLGGVDTHSVTSRRCHELNLRENVFPTFMSPSGWIVITFVKVSCKSGV